MQCSLYNERAAFGGRMKKIKSSTFKEYIDKNTNTKRGITLKKIKNSKKQKKSFWRVTSRVLCPNFKFLAQTVLAVARGQINKEYIDKNTKRGITLEKIKNSKKKKSFFEESLAEFYVKILSSWLKRCWL